MFRSAVLLFLTAVLVNGQSTDVSQCTINSGELPIHSYIEGCVTPPCELPQLQDAVIHLVFKAPHLIRRMQTKATVWLFITSMEHNLEEHAETCNFLENSYCPVLQGEVLKYTLRMMILSIWPAGTSVTIEFRVVDDDDNSITCIRVPIRVVRPVSTANGIVNGTVTDV